MNGIILARTALNLGDVTNNIAEYRGAITSLEHGLIIANSLRRCGICICIRLDSLLVTKQLLGEWACRTQALTPLYEQAFVLFRNLRNHPNITSVQIQHIYREFNAEADGLANEALDSYDTARHVGGVVISDSWTDSRGVFERIRYVDAEGDVIMEVM
jgi:ribonuclease HI